MNQLILECQKFLDDFKYTYAFCGGYALELFTKTQNRPHSDIDITVFNEDRKSIIAYILSKGWNVYEPTHNPDNLLLITDPNDEKVLNALCLWVIKPDSTLVNVRRKRGADQVFNFEITNKEQLNFDFFEIIFNTEKDGSFVCDKEKNILRDLGKAILYAGDIPYLAPEIILFITANPAYIESDYHREKTNIDWKITTPFLSKESLKWLIHALKAAYPDGNRRIDELMILNE
ncbi:hypothetical protein K7I13_07145 [Brucepastera parasyntrophica]|uniref:nucleotidyltransferase domain-containing protein n=1 Tax=Brucepastera parasyntrophica TaxID=2880008 RepID=UPI00210E2434|nr:hypothetical protein [Brucepastera parasyntrophica]ULQ61020.1 hypothetical protein K7I13_07145 [Brucepastera parasyntrophica]